jgi:hypothetical protein
MLLPSGESSLDIAISHGHRDGLFETEHDLIRIIDPWPRYVGDPTIRPAASATLPLAV